MIVKTNTELVYETQRIVCKRNHNEYQVTSPYDVKKIPHIKDISNSPQEVIAVITLNQKNYVTSIEKVAIGTTNCTHIDLSTILTSALLRGSRKLMLIHNHPSGILKPSEDDIYLTRKLNDVCKLMSIELLDHIIVGVNTSSLTSLKRENLI